MKKILTYFTKLAKILKIKGLSDKNEKDFISKRLVPRLDYQTSAFSKGDISVINEVLNMLKQEKDECDENKLFPQEIDAENDGTFKRDLATNKKNQTSGKNTCQKLGKQFSQSNSLFRHIASVHDGVKFQCDQCDYKTTDSRYLKQHKASEHEVKLTIHEGVRFPCDQCDYEATTSSSLKQHKASEGVTHPCDQCDYEATRKCSLNILIIIIRLEYL